MKVNDDAVHLLPGIIHDGVDGNWKFLNWKLIDLSRLSVKLKAEFRASNKELYLNKHTLSSGNPPPQH